MTAKSCTSCQTIHGADAAVAVGRFNPVGAPGYRSRLGGPLRGTREEAVADFCATACWADWFKSKAEEWGE